VPGGRCLDIGTGKGDFTLSVLRSTGCEEVVGVDLDPRLISLAHAHLRKRLEAERIHLAVADATALPFRDASFDAIFMTGVLHHIPDWEKVLAETHRLLVPGGSLRLAEMMTEALPGAVNRFLSHSDVSIAAIAGALSDLHLRVERIHPILRGRFVVVSARRS
jgi:ubiquinone/menaquinone biosynthesis C-methylase UbiE